MVPAPGTAPRARLLIVCEDDDITGPCVEILRRAGYAVAACRGKEGPQALGPAVAAGSTPATAAVREPSRPDLVLLDRDLAPADRSGMRAALERWKGRDSLPLILLGSGDPSVVVPDGWHEDALLVLGRPPGAGELAVAAGALLRLALYRGYRDLVHDLSQPVTTLHALCHALARTSPTDTGNTRLTFERLWAEADRLMTLMEIFQRRRAGLS